MKRCAHCGAKFGLIRYRRGFRQFCKKACRDAHRSQELADAGKRRSWYEFLMRTLTLLYAARLPNNAPPLSLRGSIFYCVGCLVSA
jgi:hypothetical protein